MINTVDKLYIIYSAFRADTCFIKQTFMCYLNTIKQKKSCIVLIHFFDTCVTLRYKRTWVPKQKCAPIFVSCFRQWFRSDCALSFLWMHMKRERLRWPLKTLSSDKSGPAFIIIFSAGYRSIFCHDDSCNQD